MIVITLTDCPPKVRGDLSKWLIEISTGVFVGNASARVRDELWERVCENCKTGRATMVFSTAGEQRLDFKVHNTTWEPVDYDGLKLIRRPNPGTRAKDPSADYSAGEELGFSRAAKLQKIRNINAAKQKKAQAEATSDRYVVLDIETTGLSAQKDQILELGALRVENGVQTEQFSAIIRVGVPIPEEITKLTGITPEEVAQQGLPLEEAMKLFLEFVGTDRIICHNAPFDLGFLRAACGTCGLKMLTNACTDTLSLARRRLDGVSDYKLTTLVAALGLNMQKAHRALNDCVLTYELYAKLNEIHT